MARILVVEDNEMNIEVVLRRLTKLGHQVLVARDGAEGVELARAELPELILMDMSLPVMDGWAATRTLKAGDDTRHIPIIALTAHAITGDKEKCLEAGANAYETKPVRFAALMDKINTFLSDNTPENNPTA